MKCATAIVSHPVKPGVFTPREEHFTVVDVLHQREGTPRMKIISSKRLIPARAFRLAHVSTIPVLKMLAPKFDLLGGQSLRKSDAATNNVTPFLGCLPHGLFARRFRDVWLLPMHTRYGSSRTPYERLGITVLTVSQSFCTHLSPSVLVCVLSTLLCEYPGVRSRPPVHPATIAALMCSAVIPPPCLFQPRLQ